MSTPVIHFGRLWNRRDRHQPLPGCVRGVLRFGTRLGLLFICFASICIVDVQAQPQSLPVVIDSVQPRMVKIFGGGGFQRLESWQSGFFVSEDGLLITVWSYVLDTETMVVFNDGRRMKAELVGYHPQFEIALLRVDVRQQPHFVLNASTTPLNGTSVLAFSNLYGIAQGNEQCSVQTGVVSAVVPLNARRGARKISYNGPAIILDAITNNPGAAGGAVTDRQGNLLGLIGRESRGVDSDLWLNYSIPTAQLAVAVDLVLAGQTSAGIPGRRKPTEHLTLELMGLILLPDVVNRTPPFVDQVIRGSAAEMAGILADDLIVEIADKITLSRKDLLQQLTDIDRDSTVLVMVQRGDQFLNLSVQMRGR